jgi:hypothetical protein
VVEADLVGVETRLHVVDGPTVLNGDDAPGGEAPPVTDAVDLVQDRRGRVPRAKEVRVQGVNPPLVDGSPGRAQGLGGHLAAEGALALLGRIAPPVDVDLDRLEVEEVEEVLQGYGHENHCGTPSPGPRGVWG